jgi:hypothetical protein
MLKTLTQEEIDNLIRALLASESNNAADENFVIETLKDKLLILESRKRELILSIDKEYGPKIDSLKKAIAMFQTSSI